MQLVAREGHCRFHSLPQQDTPPKPNQYIRIYKTCWTWKNLIRSYVSGLFVVRWTDRYWDGLTTVLIIEQVLMRSLKTDGRLTRGRKEGNVLFNDALNTFYLRLYGVKHMIVRNETRCRYIGYSFLLTARVLLYAPPHRQECTYHGLCYTSRGALVGTRNSLTRGRGMRSRRRDGCWQCLLVLKSFVCWYY